LHGGAVVTAVVAQNSLGVTASAPVAPELVAAQIDAAFADLQIAAVKIGMLASAEIVESVAERLSHHAARNIVLDPVIMSSSGHRLLSEDGVDRLRRLLWPLARIATPNLPEAALLLRRAEPRDAEEMAATAAALRPFGAEWVLLKGGHLGGGQSNDLLCDADRQHWLSAPRIDSGNSRGTGCTLSAAIAAQLVRKEPVAAVRAAKGYLSATLAAGADRKLTRGSGPLHHLYALRPADQPWD
ncbi:bifunctional hydroxymethylpyrimidine kinase/phosphomethylpyrimidine kinase, partial [Thioclava sp. BHET1]